MVDNKTMRKGTQKKPRSVWEELFFFLKDYRFLDLQSQGPIKQGGSKAHIDPYSPVAASMTVLFWSNYTQAMGMGAHQDLDA